MVDTTWNRLRLLSEKGPLDNENKALFLLNIGMDALSMEIGCFVRIQNSQYQVMDSTNTRWKNQSFELTDTLCQFVVNKQDVLANHNLSADTLEMYNIKAPFDFGAYIGIPLYIQNELHGTLFFASKEPQKYEFSTRDIGYLKMLSGSFLALVRQSLLVA